MGGGPAGLIAAEYLAWAGWRVTIYDRMARPGRKFLLAGRGGLNLTHSEPIEAFGARYGPGEAWMARLLAGFPPESLTAWCEGLGEPVFTGSSGRVFPVSMKAAPLLRAWLRRLDALGVSGAWRHDWLGWTDDGALRFVSPAGDVLVRPDATLLALGGASWPHLGADGSWVEVLQARGVEVARLRAANCGVCVPWSAVFADRYEGEPLKRIAVSIGGQSARGEAVITRAGLEGGPIYALSRPIRAALDASGAATLHIDLAPDQDAGALAGRTDGGRGSRTMTRVLRAANLSPAAIGLVQEALHAGETPATLSSLIKSVPVRVSAMQPIGRAISSAGGVRLNEIDECLMLKRLPGVFVAGEMLDWEAPTGGYLLQGCFASGVAAARGVERK